jgi:hypothetical protein
LKVGDINKALSVYLKKYAKDEFTGDSLDRERVRDILIKMKKIDPQYKKQEVKENKDKVKKYMISKGDTEEDANEKLKYYDYIKKTYKGITPARMATIMGHLTKMESVNERDNVGMAYKRTLAKVELKKIKDAILMFQKRIKKQGRVTNARDEDHLKNLIKVYKQMGGKGVREGVYEKNKGKTLYGKDLVKYFVKRFKYSTRDATAVANKLKDVGFKVPKVLPFDESVNESRQTAMFTNTFDKLLKKQTKGKQPTLKDLEKVYDIMRRRYKDLGLDNPKDESVNEVNMAHVYSKDLNKKKFRDFGLILSILIANSFLFEVSLKSYLGFKSRT